MPRQMVRFAFVCDADSGERLSGGSWRVWVNAEDTYITAYDLGGIWKASLHADVAWQLAVTKEAMNSETPPLPADHDRAVWKFEPTPFQDGRRRAFAVAVARGGMLPVPVKPSDAVVTVPDRWDVLAYVIVWMTEPGVEPGTDALVGGPLVLSSGRQVWVTHHTQQLPGGEPEPAPISAMVKPMWPGHDDVLCPGMLVVGVHLG